ncbi:MAG: hypothetical protein HC771_03855 [Synechococcales cyanobacterium CRU_2_2]|nr:hypothetical protein [Synechococcales cyanobacterium CRU_2_2]
MASSKDVRSPIETVIVRNINPFDPSTFKPGNFWQEDYQTAVEVSSIHQDVLERIEALVQQIGRDRITRTVLLQGASGSGKSHLLSRMKQRLNTQAFFAYIGPWPDNNYIWRHTLRQTVDSLVEIPANETESQLLLWLNRLLTQQKQKKSNWLSSDRRNFVSTMKTAYPSGLYNSTDFLAFSMPLPSQNCGGRPVTG